MLLKERLARVLKEKLEQVGESPYHEELLRETAAAIVKEFQAFVKEADVQG